MRFRKAVRIADAMHVTDPGGPDDGPTLAEAAELTRTGDLWLFRGRSVADHAIRAVTNAPVNHVGMALVLDDLPPLLWHAELGQSLTDVWSGSRHRGAQLHDLSAAVTRWCTTYGQRAWMRQLHPLADRDAQDAALTVVARMDGTPFPATASLAARWVTGRLPVGRRHATPAGAAYCAEVVAATYQEMGLLPDDRPLNWFDPGTFWSGDRLQLTAPARLGDEVPVRVS